MEERESIDGPPKQTENPILRNDWSKKEKIEGRREEGDGGERRKNA